MHATTFALKRGHLLSLKLLRGILKPFARLGITPARADLLNVIRALHPHSARQCDLAKRIGVTRSTISRMLIRLETMQLIVRYKDRAGDGRRNFVQLTRECRRRMRVLLGRVTKARVVDSALRRVLQAAPGEMRRPHATLITDLRTYARRLGDTATCPYVARVLGESPRLWPWPVVHRHEWEF